MPQQDIPITAIESLKPAIIVAMTVDRVIGANGGLPWHLPDDLQLFKRLTLGGTLIMGRKTYAAIGRPLPQRHNIVLSRSMTNLAGVETCSSFEGALASAAQRGRPVFIIGGAALYGQALPIAEELHISWIKGEYRGEVFFPEFNLTDWRCCAEREYPAFRYAHYRRASKTCKQGKAG